MKDQILQQIANVLSLTYQKVMSPGLMTGKMGLILFFYEYSGYTGNKYYEILGDELLDNILKKNTFLEIDFNAGITGIGWGGNYLIENEFASGDPDEALSEYDKIIFQNKSNINGFFIKQDESFFSSGLYFLMRHKEIRSEAQFVMVEQLLASSIPLLDEEYIRNMGLYNSILYFLNKLSLLAGSFISLQPLYDKVFKCMENSIRNGLYDKMDIDLLNCLLADAVKNEFNCKVDSTFIVDKKEMQDVSCFIKDTWQQLLYKDSFTKKEVSLESVIRFMNEILDNYDPSELVLIRGVAGLGLGLMKNLNRFV